MTMTTTAHDSAIGVIAGAGKFPFMVVEGAKRAGCHVTVIGLRGLADPELSRSADAFIWSGLARLGSWIRILRRSNIHRAIMAGYVHKHVMYGRFRMLKLLPDWTSAKLWFITLKDKRNDAVLGAVADTLATNGIELESCIQHCQDALATPGHLAGPNPEKNLDTDIEFGWTLAKEIGRLDIGQSIAIKETEVIAVEAIEGTDRMIARAGELCPRGGWTLIKVAKPNQDVRFDVPTVGPETIEKLHQHGARALVIEAAKTIIVEKERFESLAGQYGITVVAHEPT
jgi:UDP-2,3-diacylglucosamine hydrolase